MTTVDARRVAPRDSAVRRWDDLVAWVERRLAPIEERIVEIGRGGMSAHWRVVAVELMMAGLLVAATVGDSTTGRGVAAAGIAAGLVLVAVRDRREAVVWLVVWLVCLGTTRRLVSVFQMDPTRDPLLVVGPLIAVVVAGRSLANGALRRLTPLHGLIAAMVLVVVVGGLNPRQSTLGSAAAGVLVWGGSLLYFWIGRAMTDVDIGRVGRVAVALGIAAAVYGIAQLTIGLPFWDADWVEARTTGSGGQYASLYIGGATVRPFGMSTSAAGYAVFMGLLTTIAAAKAATDWHRLHNRSALLWSSVACLGLVALVLSAVRSVLLLTVLALFVVVVVARGWSLAKSLLVLVMMGMAVSMALSQVDPSSLDADGVEGSVRRVIALVGHPLSNEYENTIDGHVRSIRGGIERGFREPLGSGPGSVGLAASRFGDGGQNSESSISNAGIAFGVLGMAIVGAAMLVGPWTAWRARSMPVRGPTDLAPVYALAVLSMAIVTIRSGFNGEHWAVTPLLWMGLGWADARAARLGGPRRAGRAPGRARTVRATSRR